MPYRKERAESFALAELALLLSRNIKDPRVAPLSITGVDFTPDRRLARVYVVCHTGQEDLEEGLRGLESAKGYIRRHLASVLHWHFTPRVEFRVDSSWEYGAKIDDLLDRVHEEDQNRAGEPDHEPGDEAVDAQE